MFSCQGYVCSCSAQKHRQCRNQRTQKNHANICKQHQRPQNKCNRNNGGTKSTRPIQTPMLFLPSSKPQNKAQRTSAKAPQDLSVPKSNSPPSAPRGPRPYWLSLASTAALAASSTLTTSAWPFCTATEKAVQPRKCGPWRFPGTGAGGGSVRPVEWSGSKGRKLGGAAMGSVDSERPERFYGVFSCMETWLVGGNLSRR